MSQTQVAEHDHKRKRQDSVRFEVESSKDESPSKSVSSPLAKSTPEAAAAAAAAETAEEHASDSEQKRPSSPSKKLRTDSKQDTHPPSAESEANAQPKTPPKKAEFGFASAAKISSPFAAFVGTSSGGFAAYASKSPVTPAGVVFGQDGSSNDDDGDSKDEAKENAKEGEANKATKAVAALTFEEMLKTKGKESLDSIHSTKPASPSPLAAKDDAEDTAPMRTFEEDEECLFSVRAKLFELGDNRWLERGAGQFKVNRKAEDGDGSEQRVRLIMRTDATFRLILNVPLFPGMSVFLERKFVRFTCIDPQSSALITYVLRFASEDTAAAAFPHIADNVPKPGAVGGEDEESEREASKEPTPGCSADGGDGEDGDEESAVESSGHTLDAVSDDKDSAAAAASPS